MASRQNEDMVEGLDVQTIETYRYSGQTGEDLTVPLLMGILTTRDERNKKITMQRLQGTVAYLRILPDDDKEAMIKELLHNTHGMAEEAEQLVLKMYESSKVPLSTIMLILALREKKVSGLGCDARAYARLALTLSNQVDVKTLNRDIVHRLVERGGCTDGWYWATGGAVAASTRRTKGDRSATSEFIPYKILLKLLDRREERILFDVNRFYHTLASRRSHWNNSVGTNLRFNLGYTTFDMDKRLRSQLTKVLNHPKVRLICTSSYPKWDWEFSGNYKTFFKIVEMFPVETQKIILQDEFKSCGNQEQRATICEYCYGNAQLRDVVRPSYLKQKVKELLGASREAQLLNKLQPTWFQIQ
jgi:hypothetical protein